MERLAVSHTPPSLYGYFEDMGHVEYVWYSLASHQATGTLLIYRYVKVLGEFKELEK